MKSILFTVVLIALCFNQAFSQGFSFIDGISYSNHSVPSPNDSTFNGIGETGDITFTVKNVTPTYPIPAEGISVMVEFPHNNLFNYLSIVSIDFGWSLIGVTTSGTSTFVELSNTGGSMQGSYTSTITIKGEAVGSSTALFPPNDFFEGVHVYIVKNVTGPTGWSVNPAAMSPGLTKQVKVGSTTVGVNFIAFNATRNKNEVNLNWETAAEENNKGFEIQRSIDSKNWENIGFIQSNRNAIQYYQFTDHKPTSDVSFYRLKQIDNDELSYTYSEIRKINFQQSIDISLFPNPATNHFNVNINQEVSIQATIQIFDMAGRLVYNSNAKTGDNKVNVQNFNSGMYKVIIQSSSYIKSFSVVVKK